MNCVCYNIMNNLQTSLANLLMTAANNRINSGSSTTDDGNYRPNLNLLDNNNENTSFDLNTFFYVFLLLITFFSFSSIIDSRRRRVGGNTSSLNWNKIE